MKNKVIENLGKAGYSIVEDRKSGIIVALDTSITPELKAEGVAREIVHRINQVRKKAGFNIDDHIITYWEVLTDEELRDRESLSE